MGFAENLKRLRKNNQMGQREFAAIMNVSVKTVSHWETSYCEPSIEQLHRIADYFDVTLDELTEHNTKLI
ncbi:MAG: helix-turn-helix transcriptional regulator [Clostridia bacterium]|jgi:transcriptional regulator with XRE-family HTH domain|nr:helix-turn-helix transcriptional regulator [Clostridia bacterium]